MRRFLIECPYCDHEDGLAAPQGLRPSEAIRLHERAIDHLRRCHSRARAGNLSIHEVKS